MTSKCKRLILSQTPPQDPSIPFLDVEPELSKLEATGKDLGVFLANNRDDGSRLPIARCIICQWLFSLDSPKFPTVQLNLVSGQDVSNLRPPFDLALEDGTVIPAGPFMEKVKDDPVFEALDLNTGLWDQANPIETAKVIQACLRLSESDRLWKQFPGTHPVHLTRTNASNISRYPYVISKKIDGTRYMMLIANGTIWLSDRKLQVWRGPKHSVLKKAFEESLFDCEVTKGKICIIDVINIKGKCMRSSGIMMRMSHVNLEPFAGAPFKVTAQRYQNVRDLALLVDECTSEGYDGIVFSPSTTTYRLGRNTSLLKWKLPDKTTADFLARKTNKKGHYGIFSSVEGDEPGAQVSLCGLIDIPLSEGEDLDGVICECKYTSDGVWTFSKIRRDKVNANPSWVINNIVETIGENITKQDLIELCTSNRSNLFGPKDQRSR